MKQLKSTGIPVLGLLLASLMLTSCSNEVVKYVKQPLVLSTEVTDPVVPPQFNLHDDIVEYALVLLGDIERMNADRASVRAAVDIHNGTSKGNPKGN